MIALGSDFGLGMVLKEWHKLGGKNEQKTLLTY